MRRFISAEGLTKLVRTGVVAPFAPLPDVWAVVAGAGWPAGAPLVSNDRFTGADLPGFTPCVRRIDGLSACGLNAREEIGGRFSGGWFSKSTLRPVTKPSGRPGGGGRGSGKPCSSICWPSTFCTRLLFA